MRPPCGCFVRRWPRPAWSRRCSIASITTSMSRVTLRVADRLSMPPSSARPKQRNTREENEAIKAGETPEGWETKPAKNAQKDKDARWTKKNEQSFYGYKNHISVDRKHKLIRRYAETD